MLDLRLGHREEGDVVALMDQIAGLLENASQVEECFEYYRKQSLMRFELFGPQLDIDQLSDSHAMMQRGQVERVFIEQSIGQDMAGIDSLRQVIHSRHYSIITYGYHSAGQTLMHQKTRHLGVHLDIEPPNVYV